MIMNHVHFNNIKYNIVDLKYWSCDNTQQLLQINCYIFPFACDGKKTLLNCEVFFDQNLKVVRQYFSNISLEDSI